MDISMTNGHTHRENATNAVLATAIGKALIRKDILSKNEILAELDDLKKVATNDEVKSILDEASVTVGKW